MEASVAMQPYGLHVREIELGEGLMRILNVFRGS